MKRTEFIKTSLMSVTAMGTLKDLHKYSEQLSPSEGKMPILFVGHGNPMNAIEDNEFAAGWRAVGKELPKPQAILCVSAHWEREGTFVTAMEKHGESKHDP